MIVTLEQVQKALDAMPGYKKSRNGSGMLASYKYDPAAAALGFADQSSHLTNEQVDLIDKFWASVSLIANERATAGAYMQYTTYPEEVLTAALLKLEEQAKLTPETKTKRGLRRRRRNKEI